MTTETIAALGRALTYNGIRDGVLWLPLWAYVDLSAEAGRDPSAEMPCVLSPDLLVRVDGDSATCPELEAL